MTDLAYCDSDMTFTETESNRMEKIINFFEKLDKKMDGKIELLGVSE